MHNRYYYATLSNMKGERVAVATAPHVRGTVVDVIDGTRVQVQWDEGTFMAGYVHVRELEFLV